MIMKEEKRITYQAGITRTPSDFLCKDGELAECINLTTDNEELKPVVQPAEFIVSATSELGMPKILFIHKFGKDERYICYYPSNHKIYWGVKSSSSIINITSLETNYDDSVKISAVGKVLIISSDNFPIRYYIWKNDNSYSDHIDNLPPIKLSADLQKNNVISHTAKIGNIFGETNFDNNITEENQSEYNDVVVGLYSENMNEIKTKRCFARPFFVCAALELFDGSYAMMSQPILMPVTLTNNVYASILLTPISSPGVQHYSYGRAIKMFTYYSELSIKQETDYSGYSDLVKDVVIFVTDGINFYETEGDQTWTNIAQAESLSDGIIDHHIIKTPVPEDDPMSESQERFFRPIKKRTSNDINDDVKNISIFYRICSIGLKPRDLYPVTSLINSNTLRNLTTQPRLDSIDYFSNNLMYADMLFSYNNRLNIAGAKRSIFPGFTYFMPFGTDTAGCTIKVEIKTDYGNKLAVIENVTIPDKTGFWFFYPDPRATKVVISGAVSFAHELKEHVGWNGAYCFLGLPQNNTDTPTSDSSSISATDKSPESLYNYIITSEVNNPWLFKAGGYNQVGTGNILAMSTITQALSQGQFGQFPLLVFSESGIWAMEVDKTGLYQSVYPMSREVCINPNGIIQTDEAVFFVSKKGLMMIVGKEVRCVSEQMNGPTFRYSDSDLNQPADDTDWEDIIGRCSYPQTFQQYISEYEVILAYDYVNSRIIIQNLFLFTHAYVYNIKDGTISKTVLPARMSAAINNYPDYLMQGDVTRTVIRDGEEVEETVSGVVFSFYEKPREEEVRDRQLAFLLTRPIKLAGPLTPASIRELVNVGMWKRKDNHGNELSCVKTEVYVSDNLSDWYQVGSRFGAAAKYFRIALFIKMLPTERLSGTIIMEQERRNNNLRE
jgi:hypothetical protein